MSRKASRSRKASAGGTAALEQSLLASSSATSQPRTEHEARAMATSALRTVLVDSKLVSPRQSHKMNYYDLWRRVRDVLQADDIPTRPDDVAALLRGKLLETLVRLLIDLSPLNRLNSVWDDIFEVCRLYSRHCKIAIDK